MLQFLFPLGLFALFAWVAPLAIHLLSRKPGKTVKVGSLKFLEASESRQLRSLKLTDLPLLLTRLTLLAVLAVLLAKPFWQGSSPQADAKTRGWVLVAPEFITQPHEAEFDQRLDSLITAGNELHLLAPDFATVPMAFGKIDYVEESTTNTSPNYWSLLREIALQLPGEKPLWVFIPDRLAFFRGARPTLKRAVYWFGVSGPRENRWIQQAQALKNDSVQFAIGFSDLRQTRFTPYALRFPTQQRTYSGNGMPALEINSQPDPRAYRFRLLEKDNHADDDLFTLAVSTDSTTVMIWYDANHEDDARYVRTALETVVEFGRLPMIVKSQRLRETSEVASNAKWAFWLAAQPPPKILLQQLAQGLCLISDAGAQEYESVKSFITVKTQQTEHLVHLSRRISATPQGLALWVDGFGEPILEAVSHGRGWHYRFHSRFHPAWNGLVLSAALPEWLYALLSQPPMLNRRSDQRRISLEQSQPNTQIATATTISTTRSTSLHFPFWIFAVILFAVERWFAATAKNL